MVRSNPQTMRLFLLTMRIQISDYQSKASALTKALKDAGHELVKSWPDILLIDHDLPVANYRKTVERAYSEGSHVVLYSHGAPVITSWDGIWEPSDYVSGYVAQSPGQKHVMEQYNYPYPIDVIGWHYCAIKPFKPTTIKTVLFAPWHPHSDGWMIPEGKRLNTSVYSRLMEMPYKLYVRHVRAIEHNGIEMRGGVEYQHSDMSIAGAVKAIDAVDMVVTNMGTLACLAVARGKPLVVFGQDICPHDGYSPISLRYVNNWDLYRDYLRYPYDISASKPKATQNIIEQAAQNEAAEWREKFIGQPFDASAFVALMEAKYARATDE